MSIFSKLGGKRRAEDVKETIIYLLAEGILREAMKTGSRLVNIKCYPKEEFFGNKGESFDMVEEDGNSRIKIRDRGWVLGVSIRKNGNDSPYLSLPVSVFIPLLNILAERTVYKGKQGFAIYKETSGRKAVEVVLDVCLYLENDSSISVEFEEVRHLRKGDLGSPSGR
jgi:hypothetical protein